MNKQDCIIELRNLLAELQLLQDRTDGIVKRVLFLYDKLEFLTRGEK